MGRSLLVDTSWDSPVLGVLRWKLNIDIDTPYGNVVAFERQYFNKDDVKVTETVVPGFYRSRRRVGSMTLKYKVDPVPEYQRDEVSEVVKSKGYKDPIKFWEPTEPMWIDRRFVAIPRDTVKSALNEMGFEKIKGSNQYVNGVNGDISVFPSRNGTGTEIGYMGPEDGIEGFYRELEKYKN